MICFIVPFVIILLFYLILKFLLPKPPKTIKYLYDKHVVITGGSKGIGKALAMECIKRGSHVTIVARHMNQLKEVARELERIAPNPKQMIKVIAADLTLDYEHIKQIFDSDFDQQDHPVATNSIDILINNAGGAFDGEFDQLEVKVFEKEIKLNYLSAVYVTRALISRIKQASLTLEHGSRIVFLSSQAGQVGLYGYTAYSASKFALRGFAESLQMELKPYNIWITVAYPPNTSTEGFQIECLQMPEATRLISGTSGLLEPADVAVKILNDCSKGQFCCYFGLDGWLLADLCSCMSSENNVANVVQQIFLSGLFRFVSLFYLKSFDSIVKKCIGKELKIK